MEQGILLIKDKVLQKMTFCIKLAGYKLHKLSILVFQLQGLIMSWSQEEISTPITVGRLSRHIQYCLIRDRMWDEALSFFSTKVTLHCILRKSTIKHGFTRKELKPTSETK